MSSCDSDDFESADEEHNVDSKQRRKSQSSSNYSDNRKNQSLSNYIDNDTEQELKKTGIVKSDENLTKVAADGWDDFDIEENELQESKDHTKDTNVSTKLPQQTTPSKLKEFVDAKDTGWDDFDDWGQDVISKDIQSNKPLKMEESTKIEPDPKIKEVTDRLAGVSTNSGGWGWGWGVDTFLSTASAGITNLTSQVSQGISNVLETGIGAPDPEELARRTTKVVEEKPLTSSTPSEEAKEDVSDASFPFGSLISGVTKFVETTGTKVISSGLDTLETIGKKTMEVLQDGDPGLAKKRAMLGLNPGDKPVLSQVLREAKAKADEEDKIREEKREAKEVHYENLFDDFEGLVHLEALEMLSRQISMRIEESLRSANPEKRQDIKETLQQVAELCEMPEEEDDEEDSSQESGSKADMFHERLRTATQDIGVKLQFQPLIRQYTQLLEWQTAEDPALNEKAIYKRAVSGLAEATAHSVELYHKTAEMLLVKPRRSTADEADALTQMTVVLTKHVSELATLFTDKLNSMPLENKDQVNNYTTNIFLEAGNSSTYIQNAFQLTLPILQIGAV